jgi:hypothetical protein
VRYVCIWGIIVSIIVINVTCYILRVARSVGAKDRYTYI